LNKRGPFSPILAFNIWGTQSQTSGLALGFSVLGLLIIAKDHDGGASITGGILGTLARRGVPDCSLPALETYVADRIAVTLEGIDLTDYPKQTMSRHQAVQCVGVGRDFCASGLPERVLISPNIFP
jgi:hypothetical protein